MKVFWTEFAKKELRNIFLYYKEQASQNIARKLVAGITKETIKLQKQPEIGQVEELPEENVREFRYLIFKSYKIIYRINAERNAVEVFDVFDVRQSPLKISRNK